MKIELNKVELSFLEDCYNKKANITVNINSMNIDGIIVPSHMDIFKNLLEIKVFKYKNAIYIAGSYRFANYYSYDMFIYNEIDKIKKIG